MKDDFKALVCVSKLISAVNAEQLRFHYHLSLELISGDEKLIKLLLLAQFACWF